MKLLDHLAVVARRMGRADTTIDAYSGWLRGYLSFSANHHGRWKKPEELFTEDVEAFLNHLVIDRRLSASSQNQALNALVFVYKHVLENTIPSTHLGKFALVRSKRVKRVPTVLALDEVRRLIHAIPLRGNFSLMTKLLYGTGLRVGECCTLRIRDIDFNRAQIIVREGKGDKDRIVMLPDSLRDEMNQQIERAVKRWRADMTRGGGYAPVPDALEHKRPTAGRELPYQFVFGSVVMRRDEIGRGRRWYADASALDRAVRKAAKSAGIHKRVSCHTFRHSFATHLLESGVRHPASPDPPRPFKFEDDDDLHGPHEPPGGRGDESARQARDRAAGSGLSQKAEGRRQKAEGRRQKAEGRDTLAEP